MRSLAGDPPNPATAVMTLMLMHQGAKASEKPRNQLIGLYTSTVTCASVRERAAMTMKGLEHLSSQERLREL